MPQIRVETDCRDDFPRILRNKAAVQQSWKIWKLYLYIDRSIYIQRCLHKRDADGTVTALITLPQRWPWLLGDVDVDQMPTDSVCRWRIAPPKTWAQQLSQKCLLYASNPLVFHDYTTISNIIVIIEIDVTSPLGCGNHFHSTGMGWFQRVFLWLGLCMLCELAGWHFLPVKFGDTLWAPVLTQV